MEVFFVLAWALLSALTFVWIVGREHNSSLKEFPSLMNEGQYQYTPPWGMHLTHSIVWPSALIADLLFYKFSCGWTWPKKGVTYLK